MIYTGFSFAPVPNWESIMPIKAPSNYKKPEAIEKYIEERKLVLANGEAAVNQLTGLVVFAAMRDGEEGEIERLSTKEVLNLFLKAISCLRAGEPVIGYRIHRAMKLMALQAALTDGDPLPVHVFKLIDDTYNRPGGLIDPVSLLFGTTEIDINAVAARCGVPVNADDPGALVEFAQVMLKNVDVGA